MRVTRPTTLLTLLAILLCSYSCNNNRKSKNENLLKIGYIPIAECAHLYVAEQEGFFEQEGLEIELKSLAGGAVILGSLASGSIDVGFSNVVSLALQRSHGADFISVFGATYETLDNQNHALLIRENMWDSNPKKALIGAKVALNTRSNIEELMLRRYLSSIGIEFRDIEPITSPFPRMLPSLENGVIDVASIVEPFITIARKDSTDGILWLDNQYLKTTPKTLVATYVVKESMLDSTGKKKQYQRFIRAMDSAQDFMMKNEARTREIIGNYTKIPKHLLAEIGLPEFQSKIEKTDLELIIDYMMDLDYFRDNPVPESSDLIFLGNK